jgi:hypothetical protein
VFLSGRKLRRTIAHDDIAEKMFHPRDVSPLAPQICALMGFASLAQGQFDPVALDANGGQQKMRARQEGEIRNFARADRTGFLAASGFSVGITQSAYHLIEHGFDAVQLDLLVASLQHVDCIGDVASTKQCMTEAKARNAHAVGMVGLNGQIKTHLTDGLSFDEFAEFREGPRGERKRSFAAETLSRLLPCTLDFRVGSFATNGYAVNLGPGPK